jgi:thioredoxin-related protein
VNRNLRLLVQGLVLYLAAGFAPALQADPPENYPFVAFDEGLKRARTESKPIFLYFGRYGCGWCDITNQRAFSDPEVRKHYTGHYVLAYADAESGNRLSLPSGERITEMELGARFNAFATPLFAFMEKDGALIFKIAGVQTAKDLLAYDHFVHDGIYKKKDIHQYLSEIQ